MGEEINKPDANPTLLCLASVVCFNGGLGYLLMGQKKKALIAVIISYFLSPCCGLGWVAAFVFAYDAFLLGQKLQNGESIGENENALEFLNKIFKD